jgi:hypothetical protein
MCVPFLRDGTLKKGAFSSPCLKEGTGKHPAETQELEARRMAHLRASRFCLKLGGFSWKRSMRVSAKSNHSSNKSTFSFDFYYFSLFHF